MYADVPFISDKDRITMPKIAFMGAGSTVFVRHIIGDCMFCESLRDAHVALYDIDAERLKESAFILNAMNEQHNGGRR